MSISFDSITDFKSRVFRNIQGVELNYDEFDDLTHEPAAKAYAHRASTRYFPTNKLQFNAIDFIFKQDAWLPSRFSNGTYPVWYGTLDLNVSFYETLYHWRRIYLDAPQDFNKINSGSIKTPRTVFTVGCQAALIDLREKVKEDQRLLDPNPANYSYTQQIGRRIFREGYPGLITQSARVNNGANVVAFKRNILSSPEHYHDYVYEFHQQDRTMIVRSRYSNDIVITA